MLANVGKEKTMAVAGAWYKYFHGFPWDLNTRKKRLSSALFFLLSWYYSLLLFRTKPHFSERDIMVRLQSVINHRRQKYLTLVYSHESLQQQ